MRFEGQPTHELREVSPEFPEDWAWSSASAHLSGRDDALVEVTPLLAIIADWSAFLDSALAEEQLRELRQHGRTGRPLGSAAFLDRLASMVGRVLRARKGGRPRKLRQLPKQVLRPRNGVLGRSVFFEWDCCCDPNENFYFATELVGFLAGEYMP
jgi:hypothetical protein